MIGRVNLSVLIICLSILLFDTRLSVLSDNKTKEYNETNVMVVDNEMIGNNCKQQMVDNISDKDNAKAIDLYEKAMLLLNRSKPNTKESYSLLQESAKLNHKKAKELVAESHLFGTHLPFDVEMARKYFQSIPINQSSSAHLFLGFMYSMGLGVNRSQSKALNHYTLAALLGNSLAKMAIGFRYNYGIEVNKNCSKALDLYHSVAANVVKDSDVFGGELIKAFHLWEAKDKWQQNYNSVGIDKDLIYYYQFLAKGGDINAQVSLGQLYFWGGYGVQKDRGRALSYFQKAAKFGNGNALAFLGKLHLEGSHEIQQNFTKAFRLFEQSVEKGNPVGQTELGLMYLNGKGVDMDLDKAFLYLSHSARQGSVDAILHLGVMYLNGIGVARDYRIALKYLRLASQSKHLLAFYNLGQLYASGKGISKSCPTAVHYFKTVAERGIWSQFLTEANNHYTNKRVFQSFINFMFLSELGYELAESNSAFILEKHELNPFGANLKAKQTLALKFWTRSASQGMAFSRIKVGDYHYYGLGTKVNYALAAHYYRTASEHRYSSQALFNLGYLHEKGLGVERDLEMALVYYEMSARVDSKARIGVNLAKLRVNCIQSIESIVKQFKAKWDLILILILFAILCFAVYNKIRV